MGYPRWTQKKINEFVENVALESATGADGKQIVAKLAAEGFKASTGKEYLSSDFYKRRRLYSRQIAAKMRVLGLSEPAAVAAAKPVAPPISASREGRTNLIMAIALASLPNDVKAKLIDLAASHA